MTAGLREWLYCMLLIGVKGHAGMSPRRNFGRGGWHGEKSSRKAFKRRKKAAPTRKTEQKGLHIGKKSSRKAFKR